MFRVGLSTCGKKEGFELFCQYRNAGIECVELSMPYDVYLSTDYEALGRDAAAAGVTLWSLHLPFGPFEGKGNTDIASLDETLRLNTLDYHARIMEKAAAIGVKVMVIHPCLEPVADENRQLRMEAAKRSLKAMADTAEKLGVVIAVEDLPRSCLGKNSDEILELLSADERLRVCFDTNHLLAEDPAAFIRKVGSKIVTTHVSDYDFIDERHWLPGEGQLDWQSILEAFREVGYTGPWLYELGFDAPRDMPRSRELTCEDFYRNAQELFAGGPVTVNK